MGSAIFDIRISAILCGLQQSFVLLKKKNKILPIYFYLKRVPVKWVI
jgi:hypothetical protein